MPRLNNTPARWLGERIVRLTRALLILCYGLRKPAARIHQHDLETDREYIIDRLLDAMQADRQKEVAYWTEQLSNIDAEIARTEQLAATLTHKRAALNTQRRRTEDAA